MYSPFGHSHVSQPSLRVAYDKEHKLHLALLPFDNNSKFCPYGKSGFCCSIAFLEFKFVFHLQVRSNCCFLLPNQLLRGLDLILQYFRLIHFVDFLHCNSSISYLIQRRYLFIMGQSIVSYHFSLQKKQIYLLFIGKKV
jgi:hypothetical protein